MRTFSKLRALCAYPDVIDRPSARRDEAAVHGIAFHTYVERWAEAVAAGLPIPWEMDQLASPLVRGWLERMRAIWTPPAGLEMELAMGLADEALPRYVPVTETEPHVYVPVVSTTKVLTAGRADMIVPVSLGDAHVLMVDDIKTGQFYLGDPKLLRQLLAQGIAATLRAGAAGFIPGIYYARLGIFDRGDGHAIWRGTDEWEQAWEFVASAARLPAEPRPGAWCLSCWSKADCPANPARKEAA